MWRCVTTSQHVAAIGHAVNQGRRRHEHLLYVCVLARRLAILGGLLLLGWLGLPDVASQLPTSEITARAGLPWFTARVVTLQASGPQMIRVPAGRFAMGTSMEELIDAAELCQRHAPSQACRPHMFADEQPLHNVILSSFWLDRTEVTVRDYDRCVAVGRCRPPPYHKGGMRFRQPDYPVSFVTWHEARNYCKWRGARLPTEAEFERAGRGLARRKFPWGDLYNSRVANHGRFGVADTDVRDGYGELAPVASYPAGRTPDGLLDLAGNVAEWVFDRYSKQYPKQTLTDPAGPTSSNQPTARVIRGGHFKSAPVWLRNAARQARPAGERLSYVGFRCAQSTHFRPTR